jgi:hypothetical protein
MTNLLDLPQIPAGTTITIASNADFTDQFFVSIPGFSSAPQSITGTLTQGSAVITNILSTSGLVPGVSVSGYGIANGTVIAPAGVGTNTITMNQFALQSFISADVIILPPPLDLTGIIFSSMIRPSQISTTVLLSMSTVITNGFMTNGNANGQFGWAVPAAKLPMWPPSLTSTGTLSAVIDIQATDATGAIVNLCALNGPIPLTVNLAVTN